MKYNLYKNTKLIDFIITDEDEPFKRYTLKEITTQWFDFDDPSIAPFFYRVCRGKKWLIYAMIDNNMYQIIVR